MRIALVFAACLLSSSAMAQSCAGLGTPAQRAVEIGESETALERVFGQIEKVPPDVAQFIETERAAALAQRSEARFNILMANAYYRPAEVARHYKVVKDNLVAARETKLVGDQVVYLSVVLARYTDLAEALSDYHTFNAARPKRVVDRQGVNDTKCAARSMREP